CGPGCLRLERCLDGAGGRRSPDAQAPVGVRPWVGNSGGPLSGVGLLPPQPAEHVHRQAHQPDARRGVPEGRSAGPLTCGDHFMGRSYARPMRRGGGAMWHGHWMGASADPDARPVNRHTVRRVAATFKPYRNKVLLVGLAIVVTSALGIVNPLLIKVFFTTALFSPDGGPNLDRLYFLVGLMVAAPVLPGALGIGQTYLANVVGQRVMQDFRNALYNHLQMMPLRFFTPTRTGEIQSRLSNDVGGVQSVVTDT